MGFQLRQNPRLFILQGGVFRFVDLRRDGVVEETRQQGVLPGLDVVLPAAERGNRRVPEVLLLREGLPYLVPEQIADLVGDLQSQELLSQLSLQEFFADVALSAGPRPAPRLGATVVDVAFMLFGGHPHPALTANEEAAVGEHLGLRPRVAATVHDFLDLVEGGLGNHRRVRARDEPPVVAHHAVVERVAEHCVERTAHDLAPARVSARPSGPQPLRVEPISHRKEGKRARCVPMPGLPQQGKPFGVGNDLPFLVEVPERGDEGPLALLQHPLIETLLDLLGEIVEVVLGKEDLDAEAEFANRRVVVAAGDELEVHAGAHEVIHQGVVLEVSQQPIHLVADDPGHPRILVQLLHHLGEALPTGVFGAFDVDELLDDGQPVAVGEVVDRLDLGGDGEVAVGLVLARDARVGKVAVDASLAVNGQSSKVLSTSSWH